MVTSRSLACDVHHLLVSAELNPVAVMLGTGSCDLAHKGNGSLVLLASEALFAHTRAITEPRRGELSEVRVCSQQKPSSNPG